METMKNNIIAYGELIGKYKKQGFKISLTYKDLR